jgi:hypothetical protein
MEYPIKQLHEALLSAFNLGELQQVVKFGLGERLQAISIRSSLSDIAFDLIEWAERNHRIADLVQAALSHNPGNSDLRDIAAKMGITALNTQQSSKFANQRMEQVTTAIPTQEMDRTTFINWLYGLGIDDLTALILNLPGAGNRVTENANVRRRVNELVMWAESSTGPGLNKVYQTAREIGLFPPLPL